MKAIASATGAAQTAAITQFQTDETSSATTLQSDQQAVQTAAKSDSALQAAETQLQTDTATITKDQAVLEVDMTQLQTDLQAQGGTTVGTMSPTIMTSSLFGRIGRGRFGRG